ncbi:uncharacterized protein LOC119099625 [Pollicipes pollicipes]|uniref:uncharacterized protein LOC119099625 n=1 Tax=Pollicipes pollicipes TaxID=41117 RepID=UPI001884E06C|nr:uncharacterized protein LOC119099625 [Pollicipes pollicipes]
MKMSAADTLPDQARGLAAALEATMRAAEQELTKVTLDEFVSNKIGMFGKLIGSYADFFKRYGVTSRQELDDQVRRQRSKETFTAMEHLIDVEGEWDAFLLELDDRLGSGGRQPPALLSPAPRHLPLLAAADGAACRLEDWPGCRLLVLLRHFA